MMIRWNNWRGHFRVPPVVKLDGVPLRNVTQADDRKGYVIVSEPPDAPKRLTGKVEFFGPRMPASLAAGA